MQRMCCKHHNQIFLLFIKMTVVVASYLDISVLFLRPLATWVRVRVTGDAHITLTTGRNWGYGPGISKTVQGQVKTGTGH